MSLQLISVIIPTHNRAGLLPRAIKSVLNQTYSNLELIIVDDGSMDNTAEVVSEIKDERIKYIRFNDSKGAASARNAGMKEATGDYITFLDDDDEWLADRLRLSLDVFLQTKDYNIGLVYTNGYIIKENKIKIFFDDKRASRIVYEDDQRNKDIFPTSISSPMPQFWLISKSVVNKIGYFDESMRNWEDVDYFVRIAFDYNIYFLNKQLVVIHEQPTHLGMVNAEMMQSREYFFKKHINKISKDRSNLYRFNQKMGRDWLIIGEKKLARRYFINALTVKPHKLELFIRILRTLSIKNLVVGHKACKGKKADIAQSFRKQIGFIICVDINTTLKSTMAGLGRFTVTLIEGLISERPDLELILYYKKKPFEFKKRPPKFIGDSITYVNGYKDKAVSSDLSISSSYDFTPPKDSKYILIIHDLIPLAAEKFSSEDAKIRLLNFLPERILRADRIICTSKSTKDDLESFYPLSKGKSKVICNGVDESFARITDKEKVKARLNKLGIVGDYILSVSAMEPRKNIISVLRAFPIVKKDFPDLKLVIVGKKANRYNEVEKFIKGCNFKQDIKYLGYISHDDLLYLYNGAKTFVYPSYYEGFGLPIVEAFICGAAVVTSNVSSMKEIAEGAAELVDPYNVEDIARGIKRVLSDKGYRDGLIESGFRKSRQFSAVEMARQYLEVVDSICRV
jgi:glycosyltransferase involved in cell wall biosynthesis